MTRADTDPRVFLLLLVLPGRFGRFLTAGLIALVLFAVFGSTGIFLEPNAPRGVVLFFIAILAYIIPTLSWIAARAEQCYQRLLPLVPAGMAANLTGFDRRPLAWQVISAGIGILCGCLHTTLLVFNRSLFYGEDFWVSWIVLIGSFLVWIVVSVSVAVLFVISFKFAALARLVTVDLFDTGRLVSFAHLASALALAMVGAQAALPLMLIQGFTVSAFLPGWLGLFIPMLLLMAIPMWAVHKRIVHAKQEEIRRINKAVSDTAAAHDFPDGKGDPARKTEALMPLLVYRRELQSVSEWPFDLNFYTRVLLYLLIPPLTWFGAAVIEVGIERYL